MLFLFKKDANTPSDYKIRYIALHANIKMQTRRKVLVHTLPMTLIRQTLPKIVSNRHFR